MKRTLFAIALALTAIFALGIDAHAQQPVITPYQVVSGSPAITITTTSATSATMGSRAAHEAQVQFAFGAVSGSYSTCTVQPKTSIDGTSFLTLGSAISITVSSNTVQAFTVIEQLGTTSVTSGAASSTAALGFGILTEYTFSCSSYGTSAPVTITAIHR